MTNKSEGAVTEPQVLAVEGYSEIALELIETSPLNPRKHFDEAKLRELAESIKHDGVAQPIAVRPIAVKEGIVPFEIVIGERRFRAAQIANLEKIPCMVKNYTDQQALRLAGVENLQREDLNAFEQAEWLKAMLDRGGFKNAEELAEHIGKSKRFVYQTMQLLLLIPQAQEYLRDGTITASHANFLSRLQPNDQKATLDACVTPETVATGATHETFPRACSSRQMDAWIKANLLLDLNSAPFSPADPHLVPGAPACFNCEFRSGHKQELFVGCHKDLCTKPDCYRAKSEAAAKVNAATPNLARRDKEVIVSEEPVDESAEVSEPVEASEPADASRQPEREDRETQRAPAAESAAQKDDGDLTDDDLTQEQAAIVKPDDASAYEAEEAERSKLLELIYVAAAGAIPAAGWKHILAKLWRLNTDRNRAMACLVKIMGWRDVGTDAAKVFEKYDKLDVAGLQQAAIILSLADETAPNVPLKGLLSFAGAFGIECNQDNDGRLHIGKEKPAAIIPAAELTEKQIADCVEAALTSESESTERWNYRATCGLTNAELLKEIRRELNGETGGGLRCEDMRVSFSGGEDVSVRIDRHSDGVFVVLEKKELLTLARKIFEVPERKPAAAKTAKTAKPKAEKKAKSGNIKMADMIAKNKAKAEKAVKAAQKKSKSKKR